MSEPDNDTEVLSTLMLSMEHDQRHQAIALATHIQTVRKWLERAITAENDAAALRVLLNSYNLGGWTDAEAALKRALTAERHLTALLDQINRGSYRDEHGHDLRLNRVVVEAGEAVKS